MKMPWGSPKEKGAPVNGINSHCESPDAPDINLDSGMWARGSTTTAVLLYAKEAVLANEFFF